MFLTGAPATMPDLSCYTTNLLAYLTPDVPDVRRRLAEGIRLAVRTDLPPGELAFSHHPRVDTTEDGRELAYRGAADWPAARSALLDALHREHRVLAVGNTRHLPWAAAHGQADAPHWLLIRDHRDDRWLIADHFAALTPFGDQEPYLGWISDAELATALAPLPDPAPEVTRRDRLALGQEIPLPPAGHYRWLDRQPATQASGPAPGTGTWDLNPESSVTRIADVFRTDPTALARYVDDLWAAARHHTYQLAFAVTDAGLDPERAAAASAAWGELPKTLRFAAQSAARGRPRPGVVDRSIEQLLTSQQALHTDLPPKG
ncbi:hypothetical protein IPZ58_16095 [Streptomyces roseoverticillatus]|uniref:hypothetical protein n=1 Tax=Streptomyces roseoverticillatus TaxID=66429 RepID=UPI001F336B99|nr:hypothetical protein [Streptomyces roseoverticillatus]MCF3103097.1 hypothetical protein [Streptomyces roseoverticillatus]